MSDNATKSSNLILGSIAGLVIASIGPLFWYCMVKSMSNNWIPALLIGACVGAAVRFAGRSTDRRFYVDRRDHLPDSHLGRVRQGYLMKRAAQVGSRGKGELCIGRG